ncbi:hypothetical protein GCM10023085_11450 [Actinomadura viridis]|uniref:Uncharacterized protein n=1 Tax=Actinomadura viridis TaxID=58110 RepID=A0A931DTE2_9ACTN|nr:hypothetical protein [Actinomadura viridis]
MGLQKHPVRRGSVEPGNPAEFDYQQIIRMIKATNSARLHEMATTYAMLERLLARAQSDLAFHRGRLKAAWSQGPSAEAALRQVKRLEHAAGELSEASGSIRYALEAAARTVDTYKVTAPTEATGPLGVTKDPSKELLLEKFAKDREAQRHMDEMNQGLINAYSRIPASISLDLPGVSGMEPDHSVDRLGRTPPSGSASPGGGAVTAPPHQGGAPEGPHMPSPDVPSGPNGELPSPAPPGAPEGGGAVPGGTELEGTKPVGTGPVGPTPIGAGPALGGVPPGTSPVVPSGPLPGPLTPPGGPKTIGPKPIGPTGLGPGVSRTAPVAPGVIGGTAGQGRPAPAGFKPTPNSAGGTQTRPLGAGGVLGRQTAPGPAGRTSAMHSPTGGAGLGSGGRNRRAAEERTSALYEEDDVWSDDDDAAPPVIR